MSIPFFYIPVYEPGTSTILLDEDSSKHIVQVLRMKKGEEIKLTDGKGHLISALILRDHKRECEVAVTQQRYVESTVRRVSIGISLLKNANRFEWFLEKATEIGVREIIPLLCERTEKEKFREERMQQICTSAMLQSQQAWLPVLHQPIAYELLFRQEDLFEYSHKFIAHCDELHKESLPVYMPFTGASIMLIGPEGDFTAAEIELATGNHFLPVSLGPTRLRSETAGIVAGTLMVVG
jgi:16S rRNA (uracil1498-N3)-methyltransferase